jgi:hypothetical protein
VWRILKTTLAKLDGVRSWKKREREKERERETKYTTDGESEEANRWWEGLQWWRWGGGVTAAPTAAEVLIVVKAVRPVAAGK